MSIHSHPGIEKAVRRMEEAGLPDAVVRNFERLAKQAAAGDTGIIPEAEIEPARGIKRYDEIVRDAQCAKIGRDALSELVVIRLNGGLGTSMGLARAKSLLPVRGDDTFNDIIVKQLRALGRSDNTSIPLLHMTSFSTDADVSDAMRRAGLSASNGLPPTFQQFKHPKLYSDTFEPASEPDDDLNWNPPGHGDMYAALIATGIAEKLLALGKRHVFVANADNLGATVDPAILGFFKSSGAPFMMETAERTLVDAKGGHLAMRRRDGRLILRETAQAPVGPDGSIIPEFGDISRYDQFNTNNIWLDLRAVVDIAKEYGCIPLPLIRNNKTVNPRDKSSRKVIQIETAMGAAIEVFPGAIALQVPRTRFAPVKTNNDLMVVRSDAYIVSAEGELVRNPERTSAAMPRVSLDTKYYGLIDDYEARIRITPSLVRASSVTIEGDVTIGHAIEIRGDVTVRAAGGQAVAVPPEIKVLDNETVAL